MLFSPHFWIVIVVWTFSVGALGFWKGGQSVRHEWEVDKARRIQRTSEIITEQVRIRSELENKLFQEKGRVEVRTRFIVKEILPRLDAVALVELPSDFVRLWNTPDPVGLPGSGSAPDSTGEAPPPPKTVGDLALVCKENEGLLERCLSVVDGWQEWFARRQQTCRR